MIGLRSPFRALLLGLLVTIAQVALAVLVLAPEGPFSYRYSTLIQHDGYWFMNIVDRGYATTLPPINHKVMEVSNVAFFPAYPAIAALLSHGLHFDTGAALLVSAQAAAWGFWSYFFLFCARWNLSPTLQIFGALAIFAHPAAFFLVAAYSESLFLMTLLGFIYWSSSEGKRAKFWAALHGIAMSATRIVGIPCAAFPVVRSVVEKGWAGVRAPQTWLRQHGAPIALMLVASLGALAFFAYCQLRWGRWDIYMLTQAAGWGIVPDYLAVFKPSSYHWLAPALNNPIEVSQMSVTVGALLFAAITACEFFLRSRTGWATRAGIYFCAAVVFYVSMSGVACVAMESMLRYQFVAHALIVLAVLNLLRQSSIQQRFARVAAMAAVALICAAGFGLQAWNIWNFTRGNWIA